MRSCTRSFCTVALCWTLTFVGFGCSPVPFDTLSDLQRLYDLPPLPTEMDFPDAEAIVLVSTTDTELYFHGDVGESTVGNLEGLRTDQVTHRVVRVLKNIEARSVVEIHTFPGDRLVSIEAQVIDPAGKPTVLTRNEIDIRRTGRGAPQPGPNGAALSSETKEKNQRAERNTLRFRFPGVKAGSILEYRYRIRRDSPFLYDSWSVQEYDPIIYTHYRLTVPRELYGADGQEWEWRFRRYRCARIEAPRIYESLNHELGLTTEYLWTHRDIGPLKTEPQMPPHPEYFKFVRFAHLGWTTWDAVTSWYHEGFLASVLVPFDVVTTEARELTRGVPDPREKVKTLSQFVQSLEPIELMLGEGTLDPVRPDITLESGRGDVKDKAILLAAMLRSLGIDANPALVVTTDRGPLDRNFPNWNFNHMLVVVNANSDPIWIDPMDRLRPFGDLPWNCEGVEAVVIGPLGDATVLKTPESRSSDNQTIYDARAVIRADSTAHVTVHIEFSGESAANATSLVTALGNKGLAEALVSKELADVEIRSSVPQSRRGRLNLDFDFTTPTLLKTGDVLTQLRATPIPFATGIELMGEESRKYPLECKFASTSLQTWTVDFSESPFRVAAVPAPIELENRVIRYESKFSSPTPEWVEANQLLEIRKRRVLQRNYDEARVIAADMKEGGGKGVLLQVAR